jgi:hypothetical protein
MPRSAASTPAAIGPDGVADVVQLGGRIERQHQVVPGVGQRHALGEPVEPVHRDGAAGRPQFGGADPVGARPGDPAGRRRGPRRSPDLTDGQRSDRRHVPDRRVVGGDPLGGEEAPPRLGAQPGRRAWQVQRRQVHRVEQRRQTDRALGEQEADREPALGDQPGDVDQPRRVDQACAVG